MAAFWRGRVAALIVLLTVLGHWFSGPGDTPAWMRLLAILVVSLVVVVLQNRRHLINVIKTLPRDIRFLLMFFHVSRTIKKYERENMTVIRKLEEHARSKPDKVCFLFNEERWTYREVDAYSNRVARAFLAAGVGRGDVVALLMTNRVEYVCVWLGLAKIGAVTALINWNLRDAPLAHTINTARAKGVLCSEDFVDAVEEVRGNLETVKTFHRFGDRNLPDHDRKGWAPFLPLLEAESADKPAVALEPAYNDVVLYIYTSGTTGLPKAAIVSHARVMFCPIGAKMTAALDPDRDVHYCSLPLYHAAAGAYATSLALAHDIPVAITAKFSASKFWTEASHQGATTVQYIGELCRFLVLAPEGPHDRKHKVRALLGNGMSPAVWRRVQTRFGVPEVFELYGSTEGNVMMVNPDGKVGAMGFMPRLVPRTLWPVDVVQVDEETMDPVRDDDTKLCIRSKEGAAGMLVGKIIDNVVSSEFVGYLDLEATGKKILQNVFSQGDRYFVTGDLAVVDDLGYFYFKDRTGDTYRWKGENVSTAEVEAVITSVLLPFGVREVAAYGVQIPGHEGRAGMAAIADPDNHADLDILAEKLTRKLPRYALPVFVRVMDSLPMTGTHKVSKMLLQRDGFHVQDPVFVFNIKTARYEPLTEDTMEDIRENRMRF